MPDCNRRRTPKRHSCVDLHDRVHGCLLGCAVGDALGAPFEGLWTDSIPGADELLREFGEFEGYPRGQFTDDTQPTLATVEAIVEAGEFQPSLVAEAIAGLWKRSAVIGPGGACTQAAWGFLRTGDWRTCGARVGQAGNGTAMRTAALGLLFLSRPDELVEAAADVSRITHHDPRSIAGGVAIAKAAQILATEPDLAPKRFCADVASAMQAHEPAFAQLVRDLPQHLGEGQAVTLAWVARAGMKRADFDRPIITPYVVPTVLAALWTVLRFPDRWGDAVAAAIKLGGDVDTLGAIVGALMGVRLGARAIPAHLAATVVAGAGLRLLAARYHALVARWA